MLKASFNTRVFEEGGAFSSDHFSVNFSPYESYVGILVPEGAGWGGMLETGKDWSIRVVTVDKNGKAISRPNLSVSVYKVDWRWWWSSDYDDLARYVSSDYYQPYMTKEISTKNGVGGFSAPGGVNTKRRLLALEGATTDGPRLPLPRFSDKH